MDVARQLRTGRAAAGLSQRELARRAGTSQATLSAYENANKTPGVETLQRLLAATGAELRVVATPGGRTAEDLALCGRRLADVIALAEALPFRRAETLRYPRLPETR